MKARRPFQLLALIFILSVPLMPAGAQSPTYSCVYQNESLISQTEFQFDIYIYQTGADDLYLVNYQFAFQTTGDALNGGTLSGQYVTGSSELPNDYIPAGMSSTVVGNDHLIRVNGPFPQSCGSLIPVTGLKIGTFVVSNSVAYSYAPQFSWWNTNPYTTRVYAIVPSSPCGTAVEITNMNWHNGPITGVAPLAEENEGNLSVFPVPSAGTFHLQHNNDRIKEVRVLDAFGKLVYFVRPDEMETTLHLEVADGVYFVHVLSEKSVVTRKVIIQR